MRAVLFDLDGTLLDTVADIHKTLNECLLKFGFPAITLEQTKSFVGDGAEMLVKRATSQGERWEECYADFRVRFAQSDNALTYPFDGEIALLKSLQARGVKLAVVTNKPQEAAEKAVRERLSEISFDMVAGDCGWFPVKPDPTLARYVALSLRVPFSECVFVGDGEPDAQTALAAGMRGISCLWGYRSKEQLERAGATEFAQSYEELGKLLQ